jgi:predicted ATP-dependent endonuclease of OLD family
MHISKIVIKNFRLLESVELGLEKQTTVIVGRNNSGKTSLTELFRRLLEEGSPRFKLEDFSLGVHEQFWTAFKLQQNGVEEEKIRDALPAIKAELTVEYGDISGELGTLSNFVIDLDPDCTKAQVNILYELEAGKIQAFFDGLESEKPTFFKAIKERIPKFFKASLEAEDPNDSTNRKALEFSDLRALMQSGFINAQRALDDTTHSEKAVLGKVLEALFKAATSDTANSNDHDTAEELKNAVAGIQDGIDSNFNEQLGRLIPAFSLFGYPGLSDPKLRTETILKVEQLLSNHTTVGYEGANGVNLPESYNGLGPRNLIFILLKLLEFFKSFTIKQPASSVHLVFIEEPEAHLHPQMQNVFIRKLAEIAKLFTDEYNAGNPWPVQFVVTTHSSHIANEATFDSMRYFLALPRAELPGMFTTKIKDLRSGLSGEPSENREFLHKYMTLTRCDLLFADRGVLIEGPTERLLLPKIIEKVDAAQPNEVKLGSQYLSVIEVGGAYAHIFFNLLDFLNLRTLIITDLDTIDRGNNNTKCKVSDGTHSSNGCINRWFAGDGGEKPTKDELLGKSETDKITNTRRLTFQVPHSDGDACGRSFEDAFMLTNPDVFGITGATPQERENQAWNAAEKVDKTDFALEYAIEKTDWIVPRYIEEGLKWLAQNPAKAQATEASHEEVVTLAPAQPHTEENGDV